LVIKSVISKHWVPHLDTVGWDVFELTLKIVGYIILEKTSFDVGAIF